MLPSYYVIILFLSSSSSSDMTFARSGMCHLSVSSFLHPYMNCHIRTMRRVSLHDRYITRRVSLHDRYITINKHETLCGYIGLEWRSCIVIWEYYHVDDYHQTCISRYVTDHSHYLSINLHHPNIPAINIIFIPLFKP